MYWNVVWKYIINFNRTIKTLTPDFNKNNFRGFLFLLLLFVSFYLGGIYNNPSNPGKPITQKNESINDGGPNDRQTYTREWRDAWPPKFVSLRVRGYSCV